MAMIGFRSLALRRGGRLLLSKLDFTLHSGWRVGLVGRNGCGKSSLLAAILGELEPDQGQIDLPNRVRIATVAQETPALSEPALRYVIGGDAELAAALAREQAALAAHDHAAAAAAHHDIELLNGYDAEARAGRLLHGLGFASTTFDQAVANFSGGWRVRLNLARALMAPSDLLLLDEPTNHLDLDAVLWLEQWLQRYTGTVIVISHDREFLDEVCTHVVHLHEGQGRLYSGNYTGFERQRAEQLRQQQIAFEKEQVERAHLQSFINRFKAKASKAKQAQSRVKRLEKLAGTEAVRAESPFRFSFETASELPSPLLRLSQLNAGYQVEDRRIEVLSEVRFSLEPGDRVALLGANGAGKSTLVKTLVGEIAPLDGERILHPAAKIGYFAQHTVESLREHETPIQHLARLADKQPEQVLRDWLGRWDFPGERAFDPVEGFSGGERARLALALIAWQRPNVLLLDEPTNHLDLANIFRLERWLTATARDVPAIIASHDRDFLDAVTNRTLFLRPTASRFFALPFTPAREALDEEDAATAAQAERELKEASKLRKQAAKLTNIGINSGSDLLTVKAKYLKDRAARIEAGVREAHRERSGEIRLANRGSHARVLLGLENVEVTTPDGVGLFRIDKLHLFQGDRIVLLGANGAGKSQLVKLIHRAMTGEEVPGVRTTPSLVLGYMDQALSMLPVRETAEDFLSTRFRLPDQRVKSLLAAAGFPIEKQNRPIDEMSYGQRARLALLALRLTEPNFYLMDEPTNHVDIAGQEALEAEVLEHEATTVLVSHDRRFVRNLGTRFAEIRGRRLVEVDGPEAFFAQMAEPAP